MDPGQVNIWQLRVQRCIDYQNDKVGKERREISKLYQGTFFGDPLKKEGKSELNFLFEYVRLVKDATYARNPYIFCRSRSSKYVQFAQSMETVLNYYVEELKTKRKARSSLGDAVMQPPGWIGIGYRGDIEITGKKQLVPGTAREKLPEQSGIFDETIKNNDLFLRYISSWNIVWPKGYHDPREAPYMVEIEDITLLDLLANPMYKAKVKQEIRSGLPTHVKQVSHKPYTMRAQIPQTSARQMEDEEIITKRLFHIWDKRGRGRFSLVQGYQNDAIFERDWNYLIEGFPYYDLGFNEIPPTEEDANPYPLSDVIPMLPQLRDLITINEAILRHGKRAGTVIFAKKGSLSSGEITAIQNTGDIDLVILESVSEENIKNWTTPALPSDWYKIRALIIEDLMRISGFQQLLAQVKGIETATESENLKLGESLLTSAKIDAVEDFIKDIFKGLAGLAWQYLPRDRVAQILGEDNLTEEMWPKLPDDLDERRKIIQRELSYRIDAGSTRPPKDEAIERKQWIDLTGTIKATFPNRIKDDKYLIQLLKKFKAYDVEDMLILYDEQEIAVAQEENKLLMQGMRQLVSPNENDMLHLQVHSQLYQMPGINPTKQADEHVLMHDKNMQMKSPKVVPQRGDTKIAPQTTQPDLRRGGVPSAADIVGGVSRINRGTGAKI